MPSSSPIEAFVAKHLRLIELERLAEIEESVRLQRSLTPAELEARGVALLRLRVADDFSGLGGRTLLALEPTRDGDLPAHRFQPGDIAAIRPGKGPAARSAAATAVVYRVQPRRITVALDVDPDEPFDEPLRLDRVANDVTYRRLKESLERLRAYGRGPAARLRETLFGLRQPQHDPPRPLAALDTGLDASQREAVAFALAAKEIALIHGPPGTGKTTAAVEAIRQAVARGDRVLACAASNIAVDNVAERLAAAGVRIVRVGHPARLLPSVLERSLDALVEAAEGTRIARDVRRELEELRRKQRRAATRQERNALRHDLRRLRAEIRELEERAVHDVLAAAQVILATNTGAGDPVLAELDFDLVVIDEAAQALEASCWIPLLKGRRAVLAGDHRQLPPTIRSREAERGGLAETLFDRLATRHGELIVRLLTVQYRMHREIMAWPSRELYEDRLEAHASVAGHLLSQLPGLAATPETEAPLVFIDTAGCGFEEDVEAEGESKWNEGEVGIVARHAATLFEAGLSPAQVAVITPYNAQVDRLRAALLPLHPGLEIGSVDGFQGREKEAVVISLVRSNTRGEVGFLTDDRRTNVAITRARRHLAVVGDSSTVASHGFLARFIEHCQERGAYRSAWEYGGTA